MSASKTLGIIGVCTGWLVPISGVTLGIVGLCLKKNRATGINILSITLGAIAWLMWGSYYLGW